MASGRRRLACSNPSGGELVPQESRPGPSGRELVPSGEEVVLFKEEYLTYQSIKGESGGSVPSGNSVGEPFLHVENQYLQVKGRYLWIENQ